MPDGTHTQPDDVGAAAPKRASLRLNAISNTVGHVSYFAAVFVLTPIAIRHLGPEGWGIWQLVGATAAYSMLLDLGLTAAVHYQVSVTVASGDHEKLSRVFTNIRLYYLCAGAVMVLFLLTGGKPLLATLVRPDQLDVAWRALVITIVCTAATLIIRLYPSTLGGLQRLDIIGVLRFIAGLLLFGSVLLGFHLGMGVAGFAAIYTLGHVFIALPSYFIVRRYLPRAALRFSRFDPKLFRELLGYSLSTLMYAAGTVALYQTMKFMASWRLGGAESAGHMGLVISLGQMLSVVFTPILTALLARVGQLKGEGRLAEVPHLLERATIATGLMLVPVLVFMAVDAERIFDAWVGGSVAADVVATLGRTMRLMLLGHGAYIFALPCFYVLSGIGEHRAFGVGMFVAAAANAAAGWFVAGFDPRLESLGATFGVLMIALAVFVTVPAALRRFPIPMRSLWVESLFLPLAVALPGAVLVGWRPRFGHPLVDLVADGAVFVLVTAPGLEWLRRRSFGARARLGGGDSVG